jgi:hypothetical protein
MNSQFTVLNDDDGGGGGDDDDDTDLLLDSRLSFPAFFLFFSINSLPIKSLHQDLNYAGKRSAFHFGETKIKRALDKAEELMNKFVSVFTWLTFVLERQK